MTVMKNVSNTISHSLQGVRKPYVSPYCVICNLLLEGPISISFQASGDGQEGDGDEKWEKANDYRGNIWDEDTIFD